jgi:hypothetical protein
MNTDISSRAVGAQQILSAFICVHLRLNPVSSLRLCVSAVNLLPSPAARRWRALSLSVFIRAHLRSSVVPFFFVSFVALW